MSSNQTEFTKNIQQWEEKLIKIFPLAIPNRCVWIEDIDILNILFNLCYKNLNNIYYPSGQVLNLYGVDLGEEHNSIELITENTIDIIRPNKMSFHFCSEALSWSYFRLETDESTYLIFPKESPFKEVYRKSFNLLSEDILYENIEELIPKG